MRFINAVTNRIEIIPLAIIDDKDYDLVSIKRWYALKGRKGEYYYWTTVAGKRISMQRLIMKPKETEIVDHINRITHDNRRSNLRVCNKFENAWNRTSIREASSKYLGVSYHRQHNYWQALLTVNYKRIFLGNFKTEKQAAIAYNIAAIKYHGDFASVNNIE